MAPDAFGGTIGTQQGVSLCNLTLRLEGCERGVVIPQLYAGRYVHSLEPDGRAGTVSFVNMFLGESRDVVVKLDVPAVTEAVEDYELIRATTTFRVQGESNAGPAAETLSSNSAVCVIQRVPTEHIDPTRSRNEQVDVQINRIDGTAAVAEALQQADNANFGAARDLLTAAKTRLGASVSYRNGQVASVALLQELDDALLRVQSRSEYERGGRAMMTECVSNNVYQRSHYSKAGKTPVYQTAQSSACQQQAFASKKK
jgi:hypothetical protein